MPEVERICDRVAFIRKGKLIDIKEISALKAQALKHIEITFAQPVPKDEFSNLSGIQNVVMKDTVLRCTVAGSFDTFIKAVARFEVVNMISQEPNLEDIFLTYYGGEQNAAS